MKTNLQRQSGVSLMGLVVVLALIAMVGITAMRIFPSVLEYRAIQTAIVKARSGGTTVPEIRNSFDRYAQIDDINTIAGKDLDITKDGSEVVISFAYAKKLPLFGPASLVLDFAGTTKGR